eukprot:gene1510-1846_t
MSQDPSCANGSSPCSNPGCGSSSPGGVLEGLEAQVQQQLLLALAGTGRTKPFPATTFMQAVCDTSQATLLSSSAPGIIHPALEFMLLVLRSMMNDSTNEFFVLTNMNLETQESPYAASEEHWRTAAHKLQLSADQPTAELVMRA